ncbi:MAG TPA: class F sortase [Jatrophihabitans sp.]|jgi:hypothetical protein
MPQRPLPYKVERPRRGPGRIALTLVLLSIGFMAAAAISFVISPNWGGGLGATADNGTIPSANGKRVPTIAPHMIVIPKLGARAPIVRVGTENRELQIPLDPHVVGWWDGGAKPGAHRGTAILSGHINYAGVTGTLASIGTLHPGDKVIVTGRHHAKKVRLRFSVTGVRTYRKTSLPYKQIFDQRSAGRLAIVTCGGPFDSSTGNYLDNIVVFAVPA